jgi:hypothetical protein
MMMKVFTFPAGMSERKFTWIADHPRCYQALKWLCFELAYSLGFKCRLYVN